MAEAAKLQLQLVGCRVFPLLGGSGHSSAFMGTAYHPGALRMGLGHVCWRGGQRFADGLHAANHFIVCISGARKQGDRGSETGLRQDGPHLHTSRAVAGGRILEV